jgi:thiamine biosynthesis protein ThiS
MQLMVNGEAKSCFTCNNLNDVLIELGYRLDLPMAVAVNQVVIQKEAFSTLLLKEHDAIEILMPMQGG